MKEKLNLKEKKAMEREIRYIMKLGNPDSGETNSMPQFNSGNTTVV